MSNSAVIKWAYYAPFPLPYLYDNCNDQFTVISVQCTLSTLNLLDVLNCNTNKIFTKLGLIH